MDPNSAQKRSGPFGKGPASKLNQAFDAAAGMASPPNPLDGATPSAPSSDPFSASRRLVASPDAPGSAVRDALEEAALKLSSVGTMLSPDKEQAEAPARAVHVRAADEKEWDLAAENPMFNDSGDEAAVTPRAPIAGAGLVTPPRTTPRTTSAPGSAQKKQEAESFPKSYPVKKPAPAPLQGGLAGWMRRSAALEQAATAEPSSLASSDAGDATDNANEKSSSSGGFILPLLALAGIILVVLAAAALSPAVFGPLMGSTAPARWNAALQRMPAFKATSAWMETFLSPSTSTQLSVRRALPPAPPSRPAHATALVVKKPPTPATVAPSLSLGGLVAAVRGAPARLRAFRSGGALVEVKTVKAAMASVETPLRLLAAAGAGVALATATVAALLRLQNAEPLITVAAAAFPTSTPILGGRVRRLSGAGPQELSFEEAAAVEEEPVAAAEEEPRPRRRSTRTTPRATRRA